MKTHGHLKRLNHLWSSHAVYFITICTRDRRPVLATAQMHELFRCEWETGHARHGWLTGRYVIMPDHVHFFCAEQAEGAIHRLSRFIGGWKEWTAKGVLIKPAGSGSLWQKEFFDHVLRSEESYAEKWAYVRENPVRAELAISWEA